MVKWVERVFTCSALGREALCNWVVMVMEHCGKETVKVTKIPREVNLGGDGGLEGSKLIILVGRGD